MPVAGPTLTITPTPDGGEIPLSILFTLSGIVGTPVSYEWIVSNNVQSVSANLLHTFTEIGLQTVTCRVTTIAGTQIGFCDVLLESPAVSPPPPLTLSVLRTDDHVALTNEATTQREYAKFVALVSGWPETPDQFRLKEFYIHGKHYFEAPQNCVVMPDNVIGMFIELRRGEIGPGFRVWELFPEEPDVIGPYYDAEEGLYWNYHSSGGWERTTIHGPVTDTYTKQSHPLLRNLTAPYNDDIIERQYAVGDCFDPLTMYRYVFGNKVLIEKVDRVYRKATTGGKYHYLVLVKGFYVNPEGKSREIFQWGDGLGSAEFISQGYVNVDADIGYEIATL
jgi:hypothetical protein